MKKHLFPLLVATLLNFCSGLFGQVQYSSPEASLKMHPNQYFVKLCQGVSNQEVDALKAELNSVELWKDDRIGLRLWSVKKFPYSCSDGEITDIDGQIVRSKKKTNVDDARANMIFKLEESGHEEGQSYFEELDLRGELGSTPIRISILDSGISDQITSGNARYAGLASYTGYDYVNNDPIPDDENGHGTHVAGLIYDLVSQLGHPSGISFDIRKTHDENGFGNISDLISATIDAVDAGADIINMSFSYYEMPNGEDLNPLQLAIEYAEQKGVLVVASAGNQYLNTDNIEAPPVPATFPNENIISVASNNGNESLSFFSNYGPNSIDVSILGEQIPGPGLFGELEYVSGTSFSTAIVSALSAILGSRQDRFNGCEIKCILINTSKKVSDMEYLNLAGGVIDFKRALYNPPGKCGEVCPDVVTGAEVSCGVNCPPVVNDMDICAGAGRMVVDKLLVYDVEENDVTFSPEPVYGPFKGSVVIHPDGTFTYTSAAGEPDMFVYQVCDGILSACSDGCSQGVVYINTVDCDQTLDGEGIIQATSNCVKATGDDPKLLTFRYTGEDCNASRHTQDPRKVICSGDPGYAPVVYVTAVGDNDKFYLVRRKVSLGNVFSIDAARLGDDKLKSTLTIYLEDEQERILQTVELHTSGSQPLGVNDQFAGLLLDGYLSKSNVTCGNPDLKTRDIYDCVKDTGGSPRLLTFLYTGEPCGRSNFTQDPNKVLCSGDPGYAPVVYVTAVGDKDKFYAVNRKLTLGSVFSIDAASVGESKLNPSTTIYLKDIQGNVLQTIELHTSGSQPLGLKDQFAGLILVGYMADNGRTCGKPVLPAGEGDCCENTGKGPQILTLQYTGAGCLATSHYQDPGSVNCYGDPEKAPFVFITVESGDKDRKVFFKDLQVPLKGTFDIDAVSIGKKKIPSSLVFYLKDATGELFQEIRFQTSCSEPLGIGNQFGALQLKGYLAENGELCGEPPVSEVCDPTNFCTAIGKRAAIGLIYLGSEETIVDAFLKAGGEEYLGSYEKIGPGDFIIFSSLYRNKSSLGHFFLQWSGGREVEIPVETSENILGSIYGDFKVVQQLDQEGNDCRVPYSSCIEVNRHCGAHPLSGGPERISPAFNSVAFDRSDDEPFSENDVRLYPNPARKVAYLELETYDDRPVDIQLYDSVSRQMKRIKFIPYGEAPLQIDLTDLPVGLYYLVIHPEKAQPVSKKLVITGK